MRVVVGSADRGPVISGAVLLGGLTLLSLAVVGGLPVGEVSMLVAGVSLLCAIGSRALLQWRVLLAALLVVILLIPIKRYSIPGGLPFELEPYRIAVALIVAGWFASLLVDPRVRLRASGYEGPLCLLLLAAIASVIDNSDSIADLGVDAKVVKDLTFLLSFILVFYVIVSVVRSRAALDTLLKLLVGVGAFVAVLAIVEARTGYNVFDHLGGLPFLEPAGVVDVGSRAGRVRAYGPAQHPIAFSAGLVMLIPLGIYLAWSSRRRRWWTAVALLGLGSLTTMSRTSILMLVVVALVFLWLRPQQTRRLWPLLLPALVVVHFALPGTLGGLKQSFFPEGGLVADQSKNPGSRGQGRVADLAPAFDQFEERPLFGQGYGSRIVDGETPNAQILDNEWLASLIETGIAGVFALLWLFVRAVRRLGRAAKRNRSPAGSIFVALAAAIASFAIGMLTYDAFSFIQVTFFAFIVLAFSAAALALEPPRRPGGDREPVRSRPAGPAGGAVYRRTTLPPSSHPGFQVPARATLSRQT